MSYQYMDSCYTKSILLFLQYISPEQSPGILNLRNLRYYQGIIFINVFQLQVI